MVFISQDEEMDATLFTIFISYANRDGWQDEESSYRQNYKIVKECYLVRVRLFYLEEN